MTEKSTDFIPCMLIPLQQHYLLLPNTTIAEVVPMPHQIDITDDKPNYWIGQCLWHSQKITIIDLESMVENNLADAAEANKLCVLYGINTAVNINAYALPCYGVPQLIHLNESALKLAHDTEESEFLHYQVQIGNKVAYIPNLDLIENTISQHQ